MIAFWDKYYYSQLLWLDSINANTVAVDMLFPKYPHFSVVVPKYVSVADGTSLDDAGEIDGTASFNKQLLVAQNGRPGLWKKKFKHQSRPQKNNGFLVWLTLTYNWNNHKMRSVRRGADLTLVITSIAELNRIDAQPPLVWPIVVIHFDALRRRVHKIVHCQ